MESRICHQATAESQHVIRIGDISILPEQDELLYEVVHALRLTGITQHDAKLDAQIDEVERLFRQYRQQSLLAGSEPQWLEQLPTSVKKFFRAKAAAESTNVFFGPTELPHTGLRYLVERGGIAECVCETFKLARLQRIGQLAYLQFPWPADISAQRVKLSRTSRYEHSMDVRIIQALIMHNLALSARERSAGEAAALMHDMGTTAGGDSVMRMDPFVLSEETSFAGLVAHFDRTKLAKYRINWKTVSEAVHNRGLIGKILDIADKIAYVGRDLDTCVKHIAENVREKRHPGLESLIRLASRYPNVCGIWDSIKLSDGQLVFGDAPRLVTFLKVRALLFREMYYHQYARFGEYLLSRVLVKSLYVQGKITREDLLAWNDDELIDRLEKEYGKGSVLETVFTGHSRCKGFSSRAEAEYFIRELRSKGHVFTLLEDSSRRINTGSKWLVETKYGPQPLWQALSGDAREIDEMAGALPMAYVYYLDGETPIPASRLAKIQKQMSACD